MRICEWKLNNTNWRWKVTWQWQNGRCSTSDSLQHTFTLHRTRLEVRFKANVVATICDFRRSSGMHSVIFNVNLVTSHVLCSFFSLTATEFIWKWIKAYLFRAHTFTLIEINHTNGAIAPGFVFIEPNLPSVNTPYKTFHVVTFPILILFSCHDLFLSSWELPQPAISSHSNAAPIWVKDQKQIFGQDYIEITYFKSETNQIDRDCFTANEEPLVSAQTSTLKGMTREPRLPLKFCSSVKFTFSPCIRASSVGETITLCEF